MLIMPSRIPFTSRMSFSFSRDLWKWLVIGLDAIFVVIDRIGRIFHLFLLPLLRTTVLALHDSLIPYGVAS